MKERICPECGGDLIYLEELNEIILKLVKIK